MRYSVLIPMHNEQESVAPLLARLTKTLQSLGDSFEIIVVDDGSSDETASRLRAARGQIPQLKLLFLSRSFGHQRAITAAMDHADGDACVIMDGDLQDPPEVIPELVAKWKAGFEVVYAVRSERQGESFFKRATAHVFYRLIRLLTETPIPPDTGDFRLMDRRVMTSLKSLRERGRFLRGMVSWVGYRSASVRYIRESRNAGQTKFSLHKMMRFAWDAITSFSVVPLQAATTIGFLFSISAFFFGLYVTYARYTDGRVISGWASLMIVMLFFGGVQLIFLGVLGEYIGRIFEEVKGRPLYIVREKEGFVEARV